LTASVTARAGAKAGHSDPSSSTCRSHCQATLCYCTQRTVTKRAEVTFGSLRYSFGGDHPSQTTHQTVSSP